VKGKKPSLANQMKALDDHMVRMKIGQAQKTTKENAFKLRDYQRSSSRASVRSSTPSRQTRSQLDLGRS